MNRRTYIYLALPLFVLLSGGDLLTEVLGVTAALIIATVFIIIAWGVVWMRLYALGSPRPEFAVLSVLPHGIYFVSCQLGTHIFEQSAVCQNLYALTWLGFAGVTLAAARTGTPDPQKLPLGRDAVFLLLVPLTLLYTVSTFTQYYTTLISL